MLQLRLDKVVKDSEASLMWQKEIETEIYFIVSKGRGPGGQKVNKTSNVADLRWPLQASFLFSDPTKEILIQKLKSYWVESKGEVAILVDLHRSLIDNKQAALDKLKKLIASALVVPKKRKKTKPSYSSQKKRVESKRKHSEKKKNRRNFSAE